MGDTFVELAKTQRAAGSLDYGMRRGSGVSSTLPDSGTCPCCCYDRKIGIYEIGDLTEEYISVLSLFFLSVSFL